MQTAAVVIIGNEILSGKFADENGPFFIRRLRELGVRLERLVVVPDVPETIGREVAACSAAYDLVFTTGGVGPTHDDITMESIAAGFGVDCPLHPELEALLRRKLGERANAAALRMALAPQGSELLWDADMFPTVRFRNVYILPGVPPIMRAKFDAMAHRFQGAPVHTARLRTAQRESEIAAVLEAAVEGFAVEIGSYPRMEATPRHVIVTIEGASEAQVEACRAWLATRI